MITVFSGTNRPGSLTRVYAEHFQNIIENKLNKATQLFSLEDFPANAVHELMYNPAHQSPELAALQDKYIFGAEAFLFIIPEYNGSYPGILKTFLDACSVRDYSGCFSGKAAALFGVSSGRAGNLRGIEHLTGTLNHAGTVVMPKAIPYGQAQKFLNDDRKIEDEGTEKLLLDYAEKFLAFNQALVQTKVAG